MAVAAGDRMPEAELIRLGDDGPEAVSTVDLSKGRKIAVFAVPGAFTGVCTTAHVPSFVRTKDRFDAAGVDEVIGIACERSVRDVGMVPSTPARARPGSRCWAILRARSRGAMGMQFDLPPAGLHGRSRRYAMYVEDGVVKVIQAEESPGTCDVSGGEGLLKAMEDA